MHKTLGAYSLNSILELFTSRFFEYFFALCKPLIKIHLLSICRVSFNIFICFYNGVESTESKVTLTFIQMYKVHFVKIWCKIFGWVGNWVLASIWRRLFQFMTQAFIHQCKELCTFRCLDKSKKTRIHSIASKWIQHFGIQMKKHWDTLS